MPCSWLWHGSHHQHISHSLQTWLLQFHDIHVLLSSSNTVKLPSLHLECSCSCSFAAARSSNPNHILKSLQWLKVQECIVYKFISATYKLLQSSSPRYLHDLITFQPFRSTLVTLHQPSVDSSLKITDRSFQHIAPHLWNRLPPTLHVPYHSDQSSSPSSSPSSCSDPGLLVDVSHAFSTHILKPSFLF